jgi:hypothetical protein
MEFALISTVLIPLLMGTLGVGTAMLNSFQVTQVARDAAHMYARGVDFSLTGSKTMLSRLTGQLGSLDATGHNLVIFSTLTYVGRTVCKQAGYADSSVPPNPTTACTNYGHFVFTHRWKVGNADLRTSSIGSPTTGVDSTNGMITLDNSVTKTGNRADAFALLPKPLEDGTDGYQAGQPAYLVEAFSRRYGTVLTQGEVSAFALF